MIANNRLCWAGTEYIVIDSEYNMSIINHQSEFITPEENDYNNFLNMH